MADVEVNYKGSNICELSNSGTKTLLTQGKYCEDDIEVVYAKPSTSYIVIKSIEQALLTCGSQTYQLTNGETEHAFPVSKGIYLISAFKDNIIKTDSLLVDIDGVYNVTLIPSKLPSNYQQVEYIRATGTQYIDTNLALGNNFKIELSFAQTNIHTYNEQPLVSTWTNSSNYFNLFIMVNQRKLDLYTGGHHYLNTIMNLEEQYNITIERNLSNWDINFEEETLNYQYNGGQNNTTVKLLNRGDGSGSKQNAIYWCKIYKDGVLERDLIPCYEKQTSYTGLYDVQNNVFYHNAGTDEFVVGGNV